MDGRARGRRRVVQAALVAAVALLALGSVSGQSQGDAAGSITIHATPDGEAVAALEACEFYVRGHSLAGASAAIVFLYGTNGTYQMAQPPLNVTGTPSANGGYDFTAGPIQVPAGDGHGHQDLLYVNVTVDGGFQEFSLEPDLACVGSTEVPFFTTPLAIGLAAVGAVGAAAVLLGRRRR